MRKELLAVASYIAFGLALVAVLYVYENPPRGGFVVAVAWGDR